MSLFALFLGVAIGLVLYPVASAGITWTVDRIKR